MDTPGDYLVLHYLSQQRAPLSLAPRSLDLTSVATYAAR
jgi:hypothetical protein